MFPFLKSSVNTPPKKKKEETVKVIHTFASSTSKTSHQGDLTPLIAKSNEQVKKAT